MIFDIDEENPGPNQMISGRPGKGKGYVVISDDMSTYAQISGQSGKSKTLDMKKALLKSALNKGI